MQSRRRLRAPTRGTALPNARHYAGWSKLGPGARAARCRDRYLAAFLAGHGGVSEQYVDQPLNRTTMPRLTRCASSLASQFVMRTQPCEALLLILDGSGVPCRP